MTLRQTCRELVLEVVIKRALKAEGPNGLGRLQMNVDESAIHVLNSFLRMGDLHAEGVTSMELLERPREPLPLLDALYMMRPEPANIDNLINDFKSAAAPQHRQVHLCFTEPLVAELMQRLVEAQQLAQRVQSFVEVPLSFVLVQDRGFHFNMPQAIPGLFPVPDGQLVTNIVKRLVDVCRCLQATAPVVRYGQSELCKSVANQVLSELAQHRQAGHQSSSCQLLILDRSMDIAAALVHEYTYEACVYDLLDGNMLDADRHIITLPGDKPREVLLSENDPLWEELKHLHLEAAKALIDHKVEEITRQNTSRDAASISTSDLLEILRRSPEQRDMVDRTFQHLSMIQQIFQRLEEEKLTEGVGAVEQDIACGVDKSGKDVKVSNLQSNLTRVFGELDQQSLRSESKLRLLMLYFACVANIQEGVRNRLIDMAKLSPEHQQTLLAMMRTRLMEVPDSQRQKVGTTNVHRVTKEQAARFKRIAQVEGRFELSRFEPRVKGLLEQLAENRLSKEDFPVAEGTDSDGHGLRQAAVSSVEAPAAPSIQAHDDWTFASWTGPGTSGTEKADVTQRIIVFMLGGFTHSELRSAAEVEHKLSRGTEVLIGGTSLLTPQRLIKVLSPQRPTEELPGGDPLDLT